MAHHLLSIGRAGVFPASMILVTRRREASQYRSPRTPNERAPLVRRPDERCLADGVIRSGLAVPFRRGRVGGGKDRRSRCGGNEMGHVDLALRIHLPNRFAAWPLASLGNNAMGDGSTRGRAGWAPHATRPCLGRASYLLTVRLSWTLAPGWSAVCAVRFAGEPAASSRWSRAAAGSSCTWHPESARAWLARCEPYFCTMKTP